MWVVLLAVFATSQESTSPAVRNFRQAAISPDGKRVAWVEDSVNGSGEVSGSAIYVSDMRGNSKHHVTANNNEASAASEDSVAWAPDSKRLVFLSDGGNTSQSELYIADADGGSARKITNLTGFLSTPAWSPDAKSVAFLFTENAPRAAGPLMPMVPETGVIESKVYEQRLTIVDVASGKVRQLSPPDMYIYEYDWSRDGRNFVVTAAHGAGDANWYTARLYRLAVDNGEMKEIYKPRLQIAVPRWSPDGKSIAFIEGLMSDEGFTGGDIFVVSADGGQARDVTPGIVASPAGIYWRSPEEMLFSEIIDGRSGVSALDLSSGRVTPIWNGPGAMTDGFWGGTSISLAGDGRTSAIVRHTSAAPPEIWAGPVGEWQPITRDNREVHPDWGELKSLHWNNGDLQIQGWLLYPKEYDATKRYPMIVEPHGGPAGTAHTGWPDEFFETFRLSAHGYFVFYPNPRGSFGLGEKFTEGNVKDFGYGDLQDILRGVDEVVKTVPVDGDRIGITGWSYGGYMTMWAVTQTNRFRAAVAGAGIANWQSYYGENDIDEWMIPYFGASVYEDPAVYAKSAPITYIKNVKTPTLVLVGENDGECPAPQSREFWHALQTLGVETQLVIYPGEGHVFNQPEHARDVTRRMIEWFDKHLKSAGQPAKGGNH